MAILPIIGDLSGAGSTNTLRVLSTLRAAPVSQQAVALPVLQPEVSLLGVGRSCALGNILTFSANSTLTLILAYEERKRQEGNLPDLLLAVAAYQAVQNLLGHSSAQLLGIGGGAVPSVGGVTQA